MSALRKAQRALTAAMNQAVDAKAASRLDSFIAAGNGSLTPIQRVDIYRESSTRARERALEVICPVCRQMVGSRCFAALAGGYVIGFPSMSADLNLYGADFPSHIEAQASAHAALAELTYLSDLARLEWHWHAVYYAPNDPLFDGGRFAALAAAGEVEQACFRLSASLRLLASDYPIGDIWRRHRDGRDTGSVPLGEGDRLVIRRVGYLPDIEAVEPRIFDLLSALSQGKALGRLAADGLAVERLPGLIRAGWVVDCFVAEAVQCP